MPPAVESQSTLGSPPNFYFSELIQQLAVDMMSDNPQYVIGDFSTKGILSYIVKMNHQSKEINSGITCVYSYVIFKFKIYLKDTKHKIFHLNHC